MKKYILPSIALIAGIGIYFYINSYTDIFTKVENTNTLNSSGYSSQSSQLNQPIKAQPIKADFINEDFIKSPNENRIHYSYFLPNGLEVLLISDGDTKKSAASLDLNIGSGNNPPHRLGLAHYLEHMLFLGTDKYPEADGFQDFISAHGGSYNAYTAHENTNYFFDIQNEYLPEALDRFADFFIAPIFNPNFAERERNVVDSEFYTGLNNDGRRFYAVFQEVINPKHPMAAFTVGNKDTLSGDAQKLIADLRDFYSLNYRAPLMKLTLYGKESIEELKVTAEKYFSAIDNRSRELEEVSEPLILPQSLPSLVQFKPVKESRFIEYYFPIPPQRQNYSSKPAEYVGYLLNSEGKDSLEYILKQRGWSNGVGAGLDVSLPKQALFNIHISLTDKGINHTKEITSLMFKAIESAKQKSSEKWRYEEVATLRRHWFNFQQEQQALSYVRSLSRAMQKLPQERLLSNGLWDDYNKDKIQQVWDGLNPNNMMIFLVAPEVTTTRAEKYYGVPYDTHKLEDTELNEYINAPNTPSEEIKFPPPNPLISKKIKLIDSGKNSKKDIPIKLPLTSVNGWYKFDQSFNTPALKLYLKIKPKHIGTNAKERIYTHFMIDLLNDKLSEVSYAGHLAGYSYNLHLGHYGVNLQFNGYNAKFATWMEQVLSVLNEEQLTYDESNFARLLENLRRNVRNRAKASPTQMMGDTFGELMLLYDWDDEILLQELEGVSKDTMEEWTANYFQEAEIMAFVYGNIKKQEAIKLLGKLSPWQPTPFTDSVGRNKFIEINNKGRFIAKVANQQGDSAVQLYYQADKYDYETRVKTSLLARLLKATFFLKMRTEQELGYIAQTYYRREHQRPGMSFVVQSNHKHSYDILMRIDEFIAGSHDLIKAMSSEEFDGYKQGLINLMEKPPQNFNEEAGLYQYQISEGVDEFNDRELAIQAMRKVTQQQIEDFALKLLQPQNCLVILTDDRLEAGQPEPQGKTIKSTTSFKKQLLNP